MFFCFWGFSDNFTFLFWDSMENVVLNGYVGGGVHERAKKHQRFIRATRYRTRGAHLFKPPSPHQPWDVICGAGGYWGLKHQPLWAWNPAAPSLQSSLTSIYFPMCFVAETLKQKWMSPSFLCLLHDKRCSFILRILLESFLALQRFRKFWWSGAPYHQDKHYFWP